MTVRASVRELETPAGMARAHLLRPTRLRGSVVLGHGAGGGIEAPDLVELTGLTEDGWLVVRVEQPWRVAGKKVATPPKTLDTGWLAVLPALTQGRWALPRPLVCGGRSAGARVACRTAAAVVADAVLALSFPLHPPGKPEKSRADEARLVTDAGRPLAVIQGEKDPFGSPDEVEKALDPAAHVFAARGTHSFTKDPFEVLDEARAWLDQLP
ncbi:alpha/beta hydrolase family protein [Segeticoccus rhizosphaerae]|uniref:alpha/beta hydrolase family protein n=2 Tax=Segeticoccus rhizosphaerae TaxID=1104777 RepID=UPI0010C07434|nr:alpha/beta family hydrolase [Ornithinicoccus soli]